jgi:TonB-dependent SusC/RagA subfamily outer membrane receptor
MKNIYRICFVMFLCVQCSIAQYNFDKNWQKVEALELEGKFASAQKLVEKIYKEADKAQETAQIVKSFLYRAKFSLLLTEDSEVQVLQSLQAEIAKQKFPVNAILENLYARLLNDYLNKHRYKIYERSEVLLDTTPNDIELWNKEIFITQIHNYYQRSLAREETLLQLPVEDYMLLLEGKETMKIYRSSLFEILANNALDFYENEIPHKYLKEENYTITEKEFAQTEAFLKRDIPITAGKIFANQHILRLFQKLEKAAQNNTNAHVEIMLQRFKLMYLKIHGKPESDLLYSTALQQLAKKYQGNPLEALINYELADHYFGISGLNHYKLENETDSLRFKAAKLTKTMASNYPNSEGGIKCALLQKKIEDKKLKFTVEAFSPSNKTALASVEIKNIDSLYFKAYRIPYGFIERLNYEKRDSTIADFIKHKKALVQKVYVTNTPKDYFEHTTEIAIPKLPLGNYLLMLSDVDKNPKAGNIVSYNSIQKTNLTEIITEFDDREEYTILHRESGKPIHNAKINIADRKKTVKQTARTNRYGKTTINKRAKHKIVEKYIIHQGDTLYTAAVSLGRKYEKEEGASYWRARPFVFTDRAIYRPGQTVHFKVLLLQEKNGVSAVVPNVFCEVYVDSEDGELKFMRLKTNEFGSFSGSFKIPKNSVTGDFTIDVDQDYEYEGEHPFWDAIDEFYNEEYTFKVEEYKRPRFEVLVNPVTSNIAFNDSINVTGTAKALLGSAVTNAKVSYKISRVINAYGRYNEESQIIKEAETRTDEKGNFSIPFVALVDETVDADKVYAYQYTVSIEITDINGETQTAEKIVSVSTKGFKLYANISKKNNKKLPLEIEILTEDVNSVAVEANGNYKIYKLQHPERILKKRSWGMPDYHIIEKEAFVQQFPYTQYNEAETQHKKEAKVFQETFNTGKTSKFTIDASSWESGMYQLETAVYDEKLKDSIIETRNFTLVDPNDQYLATNELFSYEIRNSLYKNDGFILLKLATALRDVPLHVNVQTFHEGETVFSTIETIEKGSKNVKIPIQKHWTGNIGVRMSYVKFNTFYKTQFSINLYEDKKYLDIKTNTFRNKLRPGIPETWKFTILGLENKPSNAEVLASMYDESLDQFVVHDWNKNFRPFRGSYTSTPSIEANSFNTSPSHEFYNLKTYYRIPSFRSHLEFNYFGLSFKDLEYRNNKYLNNLKWKDYYKTNSTGNIYGYLLDETGMPLPGGTIRIRGKNIGTTTDFDGIYSINANPEDELLFSYVGYTPKIITVGNQKNINVQLTQGEALEAVAVVAYGGSVQSAKVSSSVVTVCGQSIQQVPVGTLDQILEGAAIGLNISTGSGSAGQSSTIVIRGRSSLQGDVAPLFVIDGVPVNQNVFRNLSSQNITTLSVLKDAQATALYGSRGAGGVVLVTTKYGTRKEVIDGVEVTVGITEEDVDNIETRKNLQETAFFYPHLRTDTKGNVAIEFDAPEALSRWKFQLFAHQKDGIYGSILKNAVTQKELMVVPNMPRFLREKDTIVISTKVVNLQNKTTKGIASLRLVDAQTQVAIDGKVHLSEKNKAFTVDAKGNATLSWKLYIPEGVEAIQYKVLATADNFSDGEESVLPVLKNSLLLTEAKPFLVKAGEQKTITFEKLKNNTSSTLQNHQLTLEYTSNPTWNAIQSLPYLMEYPYECAEQTFARLYANAIAAHILQSSPKIKEVFEAWKVNGQLMSDLEKNPEFKSLLVAETPWVRDAASETAGKQQLAILFDEKATEEMQKEMWLKLNDLQNESGGFVWFTGGKENHYITLHILQTFAHLVKLNVITEASEKLYFKDIIDDAFSYIDTYFLVAYARLRDKPNTASYAKQIPYLYTRSMNADFIKIPTKVQKAIEVYLDNLQDEWLLLPINQKAMLALTLARMNRTKEAKKIMTALEESAVTSEENGMYWKELSNRRYASAYSIETHALLIEAFAEITKDDTIVQELQLWLLQQKQRNQWTTTKATTKAIYALLLNPKQFVAIKDNTKFTIGTEKISTKKLNETEKEAGTGYFKTAWRKDEITKDKATINVKNNGKTTGFGAVYWQYFETLDKVTKSEASKLQISKSLYVKETRNGEEILVPIEKKTLKIGDKITVRLTIRNEKEVEFIHLKDMRAAGLEPVTTLSEYKLQDGVGYYESARDASTNFFFDRIPKGVFILEYEVRVNNIGNFSNGITTIESMYAPELRSHTKGIRLTFE